MPLPFVLTRSSSVMLVVVSSQSSSVRFAGSSMRYFACVIEVVMTNIRLRRGKLETTPTLLYSINLRIKQQTVCIVRSKRDIV